MCPTAEHASFFLPTAESSDAERDVPATPSFIPTDALSQSAYHHAVHNLHPTILNHSIRVYLIAHALGIRFAPGLISAERLPLLFTSCILHDVGTCDVHNGPQRFEVEGADVAAHIVTHHGYSERDAHAVWEAIALHSSPGIAERISPLTRLVRVAVLRDFKGAVPAAAGELAADLDADLVGMVGQWEDRFPRLDIEKVLGDAVVEKALRIGTTSKAPSGSWPGNLVRAQREHPEWQGVNKGF